VVRGDVGDARVGPRHGGTAIRITARDGRPISTELYSASPRAAERHAVHDAIITSGRQVARSPCAASSSHEGGRAIYVPDRHKLAKYAKRPGQGRVHRSCARRGLKAETQSRDINAQCQHGCARDDDGVIGASAQSRRLVLLTAPLRSTHARGESAAKQIDSRIAAASLPCFLSSAKPSRSRVYRGKTLRM